MTGLVHQDIDMILAWRCSPELTMNKNLPSMFRAFLGYTVICLWRKAKVFFCQLKFLHLVAQALDSRETPPGASLNLPPGALNLPPGAPLSLPPGALNLPPDPPKTFSPGAPNLPLGALNFPVPPGAPKTFPPGALKASPAAPKLFTTAPPSLPSGFPLRLLSGVPLRLLSGVPKLVPGVSPNIRSLTSRTLSS